MQNASSGAGPQSCFPVFPPPCLFFPPSLPASCFLSPSTRGGTQGLHPPQLHPGRLLSLRRLSVTDCAGWAGTGNPRPQPPWRAGVPGPRLLGTAAGDAGGAGLLGRRSQGLGPPPSLAAAVPEGPPGSVQCRVEAGRGRGGPQSLANIGATLAAGHRAALPWWVSLSGDWG